MQDNARINRKCGQTWTLTSSVWSAIKVVQMSITCYLTCGLDGPDLILSLVYGNISHCKSLLVLFRLCKKTEFVIILSSDKNIFENLFS